MTSLEFKNFKIQRKDYTLEVEDFHCAAPPVLELRAPSGFGKTSILRAILGLDAHEGEILTAAGPLSQMPVHQRKIGMVFQDQVLFSHQNAMDNVMSGLRLQGWSRIEAEEIARTGLKRFDLLDRAQARVGELSGGERQRVAILRATLWKPQILILDEPFQGLDRENRRMIHDYIVEFLSQQPIPMIWVDHQADFKGLHLIGETHEQRRLFHLSKA